MGWSIVSDISPNWLPPDLGFAFCILSEPYPAHTLFIKSTADLIIRKIGVDWFLNTDITLLLLLGKGKQRSAAHLRSCKLAPCLVPSSILGSLLTQWQLLPQRLSLLRKMICLKCIVWALPTKGWVTHRECTSLQAHVTGYLFHEARKLCEIWVLESWIVPVAGKDSFLYRILTLNDFVFLYKCDLLGVFTWGPSATGSLCCLW